MTQKIRQNSSDSLKVKRKFGCEKDRVKSEPSGVIGTNKSDAVETVAGEVKGKPRVKIVDYVGLVSAATTGVNL